MRRPTAESATPANRAAGSQAAKSQLARAARRRSISSLRPSDGKARRQQNGAQQTETDQEIDRQQHDAERLGEQEEQGNISFEQARWRTANCTVIRGPEPRIHPPSQQDWFVNDGLPGQTRAMPRPIDIDIVLCKRHTRSLRPRYEEFSCHTTTCIPAPRPATGASLKRN